jgi:hypothetical protein
VAITAPGPTPSSLEYAVNDTSAGRYRSRPAEVTAIRWLGEPNCEEVSAFLGLEHPDDELDHSLIYLPDDGQEAAPGDWIVRDEDGVYDVFTDTAFRAEFEAPGHE